MKIEEIDREELKSVIKELLIDDMSIFKDVIRELLLENQIIVNNEQETRWTRLGKMIDEDFVKYDEVFQALAK
ncbi:MAG: hypothetical protein R2828_34070 [Saprospiraceae bacterium]